MLRGHSLLFSGFPYINADIQMMNNNALLKSILLCLIVSLMLACQSQNKFGAINLQERVKRITLDNGMKVLLLQREGAPVFSTMVRVKVGNVEEEQGLYGLAHFFEHMAFKGTDKIGTKDFSKEKPLLDKIYEVGTKLVKLRQKEGTKGEEYKSLSQELIKLQKEADEYAVKNEFVQIYQRNGGSSVGAVTSNDFTIYTVSLPSTKMELWAYLESERFKSPVMRDFFTEVDVVAEERRMRIDNSPNGKLIEEYFEKAFDNTPYKYMVVGIAKDIENYTPAKAREFYQKYYTPSRTVIAVVGNFELNKTEKIVRKYFGSIPFRETSSTPDYEKNYVLKDFPRSVSLVRPDKPRFFLGYHRPSFKDPDDVVFDVIAKLFCGGRTTRLYKRLVLEEKKATSVSCGATFPSLRLNNLFVFFAMPHAEFTNADLKKEIEKDIKQMAEQGPSEQELQRVLNKIDANFIYSLQSNSGLASELSFFESLAGDWGYFYDQQERYHKVTVEDIKRVVKKYFVKEREVMGELVNATSE